MRISHNIGGIAGSCIWYTALLNTGEEFITFRNIWSFKEESDRLCILVRDVK